MLRTATQRCFQSSLSATSRRLSRRLIHDTTFKVGIASETYNIWESRAPLTPSQVHDLIQKDERLSFAVQPSAQRIFEDSAYKAAGAQLTEDLSQSDIILGVKRPQDPFTLIPNKTYVFFSHTIKGQEENMGLLQTCLDRKIQLLDYERMLSGEKRLISFGHYAGLAGAIDTFYPLGLRLLYRDGARTPFLHCSPAIMHPTLEDAKTSVREMGEAIRNKGMNISEPLVICVTGKSGTVHRGVMEILKLLPHEKVAMADLPQLYFGHKGEPQHKIYICCVGTDDIFLHSEEGKVFDRQGFAENPGAYRCLFASHAVPFSHCIINAVYWDARYPRLLTKDKIKKQFERGNDRLLMLTDISCDVHGSIEFLERTTTIDQPFFNYDPVSRREVAPCIGDTGGITVMGVDILPTELPKESSGYFGTAVADVIEQFVEVRNPVTGIDVSKLREGLVRSCITTSKGELSKDYQYLQTILNSTCTDHTTMHSVSLSLEGHLFDSGIINQIADVIESNGCGLSIRNCAFPPFSAGSAKSSVILDITSPNEETLAAVEEKINALVDVIEKADAAVSNLHPKKRSSALVEDQTQQRVLLLGAGRVSKAFVDRLGRSIRNARIIVASDSEQEGREVAAAADGAEHVTIDITNEYDRLSSLIEESDVVVSLLPAPFHPRVATECLVQKKHLVTASYQSDELLALRERAESAGIILLNEVGLDPGLDHMSAMRIIDGIKLRGGCVRVFSSCCGGLPAPEAADNPLKYKFSWNPMGVMRASCSDARFRSEGRLVSVAGSDLLQSVKPFPWPGLELECLPNRDSIKYEKFYGVEEAETLFRGTLRYSGFAALLDVFQKMGLLQSNHSDAETWEELLEELGEQLGGFPDVRDFVASCARGDESNAARTLEALQWLGMLEKSPILEGTSIVESFCGLLQRRLAFGAGERDMVLMHHNIEAVFQDGKMEQHQSSLTVFGDTSGSAMSKTVGFTAAAATELILDGTLRGERGLLLPTKPAIYNPILERVTEEGISFEESCRVLHDNDSRVL